MELLGGVVFGAFILFILTKLGFAKVKFGDFREEKKAARTGGSGSKPGEDNEK